MNPADLRLLFESRASLVITFQDLIAFRIPLVFSSESSFDTYRATCRLTLPAVQHTIAYSQSVRHEIAGEFGIPLDEITVIMLAADKDADFRTPEARATSRSNHRYFFSLASDYPHKNLPTLLEAYRQFRSCWTAGEPPELILAGYSSGARTGLYPQLEFERAPDGVRFLGPVSNQRLRVLYKHAEALVFASVYEGFGLPPLEAMAAGTPVIALPISAMPEVGGDGVLYSDGPSAAALSRAMQRVASQEDLRNELREKGFARAQNFHWEKTARETLAVYRSTVLCPSHRSLRTRRLLRDVIIDWSDKSSRHRGDGSSQPLGILDAGRALETALRTRVRREFRRFRLLALPKTG
jgi:glycosyltransferase involved in cell wall biosynthesis